MSDQVTLHGRWMSAEEATKIVKAATAKSTLRGGFNHQIEAHLRGHDHTTPGRERVLTAVGEPYWQDDGITLYHGHVLDVLAALPAESINCVVTSPPYWGPRNYAGGGNVWGGDSDCQHEWNMHSLPGIDGGAGSPKLHTHGTTNYQNVSPSEYGFCQRCGAWFGQFGLEPTPELYVEHTMMVFDQLWRVLRPDGTVWWNIGDTYYHGKGRSGAARPEKDAARRSADTTLQRGECATGEYGLIVPGDAPHPVIKPKDMVLTPFSVALAARERGWYVRATVIWDKSNAMPESVKDRPTDAHEYIFLFSKEPRYAYDAEAIQEPASQATVDRLMQAGFFEQTGGEKDYGKTGTNPNRSARRVMENMRRRLDEENQDPDHEYLLMLSKQPGYYYDQDAIREPIARDWDPESNDRGVHAGTAKYVGVTQDAKTSKRNGPHPMGRNSRSVWRFATTGYPGKHFAVFPIELPRRCIAAGCPTQICIQCGKPRKRIVQRHTTAKRPERPDRDYPGDSQDRGGGFATEYVTEGWSDCGCGVDFKPGVALDPFFGSGTTALAARELGVHCIGIDVSKEYLRQARLRITVGDKELRRLVRTGEINARLEEMRLEEETGRAKVALRAQQEMIEEVSKHWKPIEINEDDWAELPTKRPVAVGATMDEWGPE